MKPTSLRLLFIASLALAAPTVQGAISIGWNYQGVGGVGLSSTDVAGAPGFEQDNWNNHAVSGQGTGATPLNDLLDDSGNVTTVDVTGWTLATANSWQHGQTGSPNEILMNDFNNKEPSITFGAIPFAAYDVVVYYGNNEGPSTSLLTVGGLSRTITTGNTAMSSFGAIGFLEGTDLNTGVPTNYAVFTGLNSSSLTVSLSTDNNNGISAIQIVEQIPEPSSVALLGIGFVALARRRRR